MTTALFSHPASLGHVTPDGHPERVARIEAVLARLAAPEFAGLMRREAPRVTDAALSRCHPPDYLAEIEAARPASGLRALDADTSLSPGSLEAALRAAGAGIAAVDLVLSGAAGNAFCAMRPPGHHAERARAMGFCIYGNVAVAARHALEHHGLSRLAVVDFDVHHGNGTQDLLWEEARAAFVSTHQYPFYPGTGAPGERGAHGQILNLPMPAGTGSAAYRRLVETRMLPFVEAAAPELILVSAGFDAHRDDPLAQCALTAADFGWMTEALCDVAARVCGGKLVSLLEGGYDLAALSDSVAAHVGALMAAAAE